MENLPIRFLFLAAGALPFYPCPVFYIEQPLVLDFEVSYLRVTIFFCLIYVCINRACKLEIPSGLILSYKIFGIRDAIIITTVLSWDYANMLCRRQALRMLYSLFKTR